MLRCRKGGKGGSLETRYLSLGVQARLSIIFLIEI